MATAAETAGEASVVGDPVSPASVTPEEHLALLERVERLEKLLGDAVGAEASIDLPFHPTECLRRMWNAMVRTTHAAELLDSPNQANPNW